MVKRALLTIWLGLGGLVAAAADPPTQPGPPPTAREEREEREEIIDLPAGSDATEGGTGGTGPGDAGPDETGMADPAQADLAAVRECLGCCPGWMRYASFDALFLGRSETATDRPLVVANGLAPAPGRTLLSTDDLRYATSISTRVFYGWHAPGHVGWEVGYVGVYGMHADARVTGDDTLALPGGLGLIQGSGFDDAVAVRPFTTATLNMAEINWFSRDEGGRDPNSPYPWRRCHDLPASRDWLVGIRWAGLDEMATLDVTCCEGESPSSYRVTTSSQLIGPQVGYRRRSEWGGWAFEGWAKVALVGAILSQEQGELVGPFDGVEVRGPRSGTAGDVGMIGDLTFSLARRLNDTWGLRAGYNLIWLTGVALAANQWDFTTTDSSGTGLVGDSTLFLHGASLGIEARW